MNFFLTGATRSRTAWWANLLTWGDSFCWHEGVLIPGMTPIEMRTKALDSPLNTVGVSDPALLCHWRKVCETFPNAKWVAVHRPFLDALYATQAIEPDITEDMMLSLYQELTALTVQASAFIVNFDLITPQTCYAVADYLGVCIGPIERVQQLCDMNVQIHPPILKARLEKLKRQQIVDTAA